MIARCATRRAFLAVSALSGLTLLSGCATLGGNVRGSFSCEAPDGICAPSSSIDDRALAMIAGGSSTNDPITAGTSPADRSKARMRTAPAGRQLPLGPVDPRRTQERVLRIVFQPYIDGRGRLHEASAVHAVVQNGEWQQQTLANATAIPDRRVADVLAAESLAEAVDRADLAGSQAFAIDPNLPNPAIVAAARARRADPVKAIQDDVAARLAPKAGRTPVQPAAATTAKQAEHQAEGGPKPVAASAPVTTVGSTGLKPVPAQAAPVTKTTAGSEAMARLKASTEYKDAATRAESDARGADRSGALPDPSAKPKPTVRAAGFPAAPGEEN